MAKKQKRHIGHKHPYKELTDEQEFQLMKIVLDKFLWLGTVFIGIGLYLALTEPDLYAGVKFAAVGIGVMIFFWFAVVRYFENHTS
ncbi:hypothetical protein GF342_01395 [Candidatus Woesearchaeota archaeon]|nr:hypothetical protein [Candidatus Woesearchaeota archaeon]